MEVAHHKLYPAHSSASTNLLPKLGDLIMNEGTVLEPPSILRLPSRIKEGAKLLILEVRGAIID